MNFQTDTQVDQDNEVRLTQKIFSASSALSSCPHPAISESASTEFGCAFDANFAFCVSLFFYECGNVVSATDFESQGDQAMLELKAFKVSV